jgi:hypothetical protein
MLNLPSWPSFNHFKSTPSLLRTILSTYLTIPLTILDALYRMDLPSIGDKLIVHVLGAEERFELKNEGVIFEEILHQLPFLGELAVEFVGPEVGDNVAGYDVPMTACVACTASGKRMNYTKSK